MKICVIETTDNQHLGLTFELENPMIFGQSFPMPGGSVFRVDETRDNGDGTFTYKNPHYVATAREVSG